MTCPVKLHLSCDEFRGELLELDFDKSREAETKLKPSKTITSGKKASENRPQAAKQCFSVRRMVPPGKVLYYYTIDGIEKINPL